MIDGIEEHNIDFVRVHMKSHVIEKCYKYQSPILATCTSQPYKYLVMVENSTTKKLAFISLGLVDFTLHLPDRQVKVWGEISFEQI